MSRRVRVSQYSDVVGPCHRQSRPLSLCVQTQRARGRTPTADSFLSTALPTKPTSPPSPSIHFLIPIMDINERIKLVQKVQGELWEDRLNKTHQSGRLCTWVSSFYHDHLPCWLADNNLCYGSYNAGSKLIFSNSTTWLL